MNSWLWDFRGKETAAGEQKTVISLRYLARRIWNVQDYAGMDCSPLIIISVKYCWTYEQPQGISPTLNNKASPAVTEGSSWDLQPESWHDLGSILSPSLSSTSHRSPARRQIMNLMNLIHTQPKVTHHRQESYQDLPSCTRRLTCNGLLED